MRRWAAVVPRCAAAHTCPTAHKPASQLRSPTPAPATTARCSSCCCPRGGRCTLARRRRPPSTLRTPALSAPRWCAGASGWQDAAGWLVELVVGWQRAAACRRAARPGPGAAPLTPPPWCPLPPPHPHLFLQYNPGDYLIDVTSMDYRGPEAEAQTRKRVALLADLYEQRAADVGVRARRCLPHCRCIGPALQRLPPAPACCTYSGLLAAWRRFTALSPLALPLPAGQRERERHQRGGHAGCGQGHAGGPISLQFKLGRPIGRLPELTA